MECIGLLRPALGAAVETTNDPSIMTSPTACARYPDNNETISIGRVSPERHTSNGFLHNQSLTPSPNPVSQVSDATRRGEISYIVDRDVSSSISTVSPHLGADHSVGSESPPSWGIGSETLDEGGGSTHLKLSSCQSPQCPSTIASPSQANSTPLLSSVLSGNTMSDESYQELTLTAGSHWQYAPSLTTPSTQRTRLSRSPTTEQSLGQTLLPPITREQTKELPSLSSLPGSAFRLPSQYHLGPASVTDSQSHVQNLGSEWFKSLPRSVVVQLQRVLGTSDFGSAIFMINKGYRCPLCPKKRKHFKPWITLGRFTNHLRTHDLTNHLLAHQMSQAALPLQRRPLRILLPNEIEIEATT